MDLNGLKKNVDVMITHTIWMEKDIMDLVIQNV